MAVIRERIVPVGIGLQWGHGREAMDGTRRMGRTTRTASFNGATAVRPWMAIMPHTGAFRQGPLQWGHGREAMDGFRLARLFRLVALLQWGHGREAMDGPP